MTTCKNCNRARENHAQPRQPEPVNMSRIFEALQRSESERSGTTIAPAAPATELLRVVEREANALAPKHVPANVPAPQDFAEREFATNDLSQFQSLPVSLPQDSKLV